MRPPPCPHLDDLARAAGGPLPEALARHAAGCPECADARLVHGFLRAGAARLAPLGLPDAAAVRRRAELRERAARTERALRPIALFDRLGLAAGGAVLGALVLGKGAPAVAWLRALGAAGGNAAHSALSAVPAATAAHGALHAASAISALGAGVPAAAAMAVATILLAAPPLVWSLYLGWVDE
ncbi:MAG TPA: hypothetical protein VKY89_20940 [Thermoanaerobaculia bacterium]|nr:hypothetical protein [Thermoanaerobaculia bacterium]